MARRSPAGRSATAGKPVPPVAVVRAARVQFAHESEAEFARILDFYGISWLYEPRSFPLRWEGERILEAFTPDFFLPDLNLYLELTTLRQKLTTEKNRKVRQLRELYPQVNVKLLNKKDYLRLLAKYGYGPPEAKKLPDIDRVLISASQIQRRVGELGAQISRDYSGQAPMAVGVLKGVFFFMADLLRHISLPLSVDFMAISSYEGDSGGAVTILKDLDLDIAEQHVLLVEDIVDTGMTLNRILERLWSHRPASLKVCALLDKRARRLVDVPLDYIAFEIPDEFVVGYGLDYRQRYRNLPFIGVLKHELLS
jgi:hypoxanthine phosphoribosyltransferase